MHWMNFEEVLFWKLKFSSSILNFFMLFFSIHFKWIHFDVYTMNGIDYENHWRGNDYLSQSWKDNESWSQMYIIVDNSSSIYLVQRPSKKHFTYHLFLLQTEICASTLFILSKSTMSVFVMVSLMKYCYYPVFFCHIGSLLLVISHIKILW